MDGFNFCQLAGVPKEAGGGWLVLVESGLLALCGSVLGVGFAYAIDRMLLLFLNRSTPAVQQMHVMPDSTALIFSAVFTAVCVLLFGVGPALQASRTRISGSSTGNTRSGNKIRKIFVIAQVALSIIVIFTAALLTQTLRNLQTVHLGYNPVEIAEIEIKPATGGYSGVQADAFYRRMVDRFQQLPDVKSASTALGANLRQSGF